MVVDNTSYWRMNEDVPLVVVEVNPDAAEGHRGIVANPNCTTMVMRWPWRRSTARSASSAIVVSTYQAVSGTGQRAVEELRAQSQAVLAGEESPARSPIRDQIAFNVLRQVETFEDGDDYTTEEP